MMGWILIIAALGNLLASLSFALAYDFAPATFFLCAGYFATLEARK